MHVHKNYLNLFHYERGLCESIFSLSLHHHTHPLVTYHHTYINKRSVMPRQRRDTNGNGTDGEILVYCRNG